MWPTFAQLYSQLCSVGGFLCLAPSWQLWSRNRGAWQLGLWSSDVFASKCCAMSLTTVKKCRLRAARPKRDLAAPGCWGICAGWLIRRLRALAELLPVAAPFAPGPSQSQPLPSQVALDTPPAVAEPQAVAGLGVRWLSYRVLGARGGRETPRGSGLSQRLPAFPTIPYSVSARLPARRNRRLDLG